MRDNQPEPDSEDGFRVVERPSGGSTIFDPAMVAYLESSAPQPTQAALDAVLELAARVRVFGCGVANGELLDASSPPLIDTADPAHLSALHTALRISAPAGHCMCHGDLGLELLDAHDQPLALVGLHHGVSIRWNAWKDDAALVDGRLVLDWLHERGVPGPRDAYEEEQRRTVELQAEYQRWLDATPECLRPLAAERERLNYPGVHTHEHESLAACEGALADAYPDERVRIRVLFEWYGWREGSWSSWSGYEVEADTLLMRYPTTALIAALEAAVEPSPQLLEGAGRLFAGGMCFQREREGDCSLLGDGLKRRLLAHALPTDDVDKALRAQRAFG